MRPLPFRSASARFRILSFLFFLSALHRFRLPGAFPTPRELLSSFPDPPRSLRLVSRSFLPVPLIRLACSFPFALPCFAPTAVPQVLPIPSAFTASILGFVHASVHSGSTQVSLSFPFAPVRLGLRYLVSASSFPRFKLPPRSGFHSALRPPFPFSGSLLPSLSAFLAPLRSAFASRGFSPGARSLSGSSARAVLRLRYSVPLLFLSPPHDIASQRLSRALAFPLGFRPSP